MKSYLLRMTDEQYAKARELAEEHRISLKDVFLSGIGEAPAAASSYEALVAETRVLRKALEISGQQDALVEAARIVRDGNW